MWLFILSTNHFQNIVTVTDAKEWKWQLSLGSWGTNIQFYNLSVSDYLSVRLTVLIHDNWNNMITRLLVLLAAWFNTASRGRRGIGRGLDQLYTQKILLAITSMAMKINGKVESVWVETVTAKDKLNVFGGCHLPASQCCAGRHASLLQEVNGIEILHCVLRWYSLQNKKLTRITLWVTMSRKAC